MKVLHMTLKREWFNKILSGKKTEEYREIKPYWSKRLSKEYDIIQFRNGYGSKVPAFDIELLNIKVGIGKRLWGAPDEEVYILSLGKLLTTYNIGYSKPEDGLRIT